MNNLSNLEGDRDILAAGLALGLLAGEERALAIRRQLADPQFAALVAYWHGVAERWLEQIEPVDVSPDFADRIEAAIEQDSVPQPTPGRAGLLTRIWALTATAASIALAIGLATAIGRQQPRNQVIIAAQPANVAQITGSGGAVLLSASYDPATGALHLRGESADASGLAPELWVIPGDGKPRSLGQLRHDRMEISLEPGLRQYLTDGVTMALTMEPTDSPRHDAPTGAVVGTTSLQAVDGRIRS